MFEGPKPAPKIQEFYFPCVFIEVESITSNLAMDNALSVVQNSKTLNGADGKVQEGRYLDFFAGPKHMILCSQGIVLSQISGVPRWTKVDEVSQVIGTGVLEYRDDQRNFVRLLGRNPQKLQGLHNMLSLGVIRPDKAGANMISALLAQTLQRDSRKHPFAQLWHILFGSWLLASRIGLGGLFAFSGAEGTIGSGGGSRGKVRRLCC